MRFWSLFALLIVLSLTSCQVKRGAQQRPLAYGRAGAKVIVVDPGHGGKNLGAHSKKNQYQEKDFALITGLMIKDHLEKMGYEVIMTRYQDNFLSLKKRAEVANSVQADLFLSVHFNAAKNTSAHGQEVFYYTDSDTNRRVESKKLASYVLKGMLHATGAKNRGVKSANLAVTRETRMPAILIEGGFLTNPQEREQLRNTRYLDRIAWGVAQGVHQYIR